MSALRNINIPAEVDTFYQTSSEIQHEFAHSAKTAIARRDVCAPLKEFLAKHSRFVKGSVLHFAKGKDAVSHDTLALKSLAGQCAEYDYTFARNLDIFNGHYEFIHCAYCVNVLPPEPRKLVWKTLASLCSEARGHVLVSARSDKDRGIHGEKFADGVRTRKLKTFQKGYKLGELRDEALEVFPNVVELPTTGAYRMVLCSFSEITL